MAVRSSGVAGRITTGVCEMSGAFINSVARQPDHYIDEPRAPLARSPATAGGVTAVLVGSSAWLSNSASLFGILNIVINLVK